MAETAEQALTRLDFSGERLLGLARRCALDHCRRIPRAPGGMSDELASFLTEQALVAVLRYDRSRSGQHYELPSFLYDVMNARITDYYRKKAEGYGDSRHGNNNRLVLKDDPYKDLDEAGVEDDDAFVPSVREEAEKLALEHDLSDEATWTLVMLVVPIADGCGPKEAATRAGVGTTRAHRLVNKLRAELELDGVT